MVHPGAIVILDFGGQYAHLIANRVRRLGAYSEIREPETDPNALQGAAGIILSGGPQSVYDAGSPQANPKIFDLGIPVLGLCYGHQWVAHALGGEVGAAKTKEYGETAVRVLDAKTPLLKGLPERMTVWMSHGDEVSRLPKGFKSIAASDACTVAAMADEERRIFGIQFHIEVTHTEYGMEILKRFVELCHPTPWSIDSFEEHVVSQVRKEVGDRKVFMLVSGGVDSTVAFALLNKVLGVDRVQGLLVDTGLMRKDEVRDISQALQTLGMTNLHVEDASAEFFRNLQGAYEPEAKRRIIGDTFLAVQKRVSEEMHLRAEDGWMLGQGTIYPDTIETGGTKHADHIKTHHNRVPAIQKMIDQGLVIEPLKELYKDEVRCLGAELGLPHELVWRHPFPGPGLGVRILCAEKSDDQLPFKTPEEKQSTEEFLASQRGKVLPIKSVGVQGDGRTYRHAVAFFSEQPLSQNTWIREQATKIPNTMPAFNRVLLCTSHPRPVDITFSQGYLTRERADLLREADAIVLAEMQGSDLYATIWQFPVVLLPFGTRPGGQSIVLRPITSTDAMTANAFVLPDDVLQKMTMRILKAGVDLVFLDLTNKPPATIEWE